MTNIVTNIVTNTIVLKIAYVHHIKIITKIHIVNKAVLNIL